MLITQTETSQHVYGNLYDELQMFNIQETRNSHNPDSPSPIINRTKSSYVLVQILIFLPPRHNFFFFYELIVLNFIYHELLIPIAWLAPSMHKPISFLKLQTHNLFYFDIFNSKLYENQQFLEQYKCQKKKTKTTTKRKEGKQKLEGQKKV